MLKQVNSNYILKNIFEYVPEGIYLKLIHHNKGIQNKLDIPFDDFKKYSQKIIIEIKSTNEILEYSKIINISGDASAYHIYFDDGKEEKKINFQRVIKFQK